MFMDKPEFKITSGVGKQIYDWCNSGADLDEMRSQIRKCNSHRELNELYVKFADYADILNLHFVDQQNLIKKNKID